MEPRPDLVTGTVFKTVVGAPQAPGRVRFPCGSAIFLILFAACSPSWAAAPSIPDVRAIARDAASRLARTRCDKHENLQRNDLRALLRGQGVLDAAIWLCTSEAADEKAALLELERCAGPRARAMAADIVERASVVVDKHVCGAAVVVHHAAVVQPLPALVAPFARLPLVATLQPPYEKGRWLMMDPRGRVEELRTSVDASSTCRAEASLHAGPGLYTVQLLVDSPAGPRVAAQGTISVASENGAPVAMTMPGAGAGASAQDVYAGMRLMRSRLGLTALQTNEALEATARARLSTVLRDGQLLHVDGDGRDVAAIYALQPGAPPATRLGEVLAAGPTAQLAFAALLESPAHRLQLQDPAFTDVGLALGRQDALDEWILVVALARPVAESAAGQARALVLARLNEERARRHVEPLVLEPSLFSLAEDHARLIAGRRSLSDRTAEGRLLSDVALRRSRADAAGVQLYRVSRPDEVSGNPTVLDRRYRRAAIGLQHGSGVDGIYVVVLLLQP